jgi:hypothetical protein
VVADPGHRQVGQDVAWPVSLSKLHAALRRGDEGGVGLADALRLAGGARGVEHHRDIVGAPLLDLGRSGSRDGSVVDPPHLHHSSRPCRKVWL